MKHNDTFTHKGYTYRFIAYVKQDTGDRIVCECLEGWMRGEVFALRANEVSA